MYSTFSWMPTYIHASLKMQWIKLLEESHLGSKTQRMVANLNIIRMTITVTKHLQGRGAQKFIIINYQDPFLRSQMEMITFYLPKVALSKNCEFLSSCHSQIPQNGKTKAHIV